MTAGEINVKCALARGCTIEDYRHEEGLRADYAGDLNACAELRATLTDEEQVEYGNFLRWQIIEECHKAKTIGGEVFVISDAKPRIHCLAYLHAKGVVV